MSSLKPREFADQAIRRLNEMSDEEVRRKLGERCPELLEAEPTAMPADAMVPERQREKVPAKKAEVAKATLIGLKAALPVPAAAAKAKGKGGAGSSPQSPLAGIKMKCKGKKPAGFKRKAVGRPRRRRLR